MKEVKGSRRRGARVSMKHQVTIPHEAFHAAGLQAGDRLVARADGPGRVLLERELDVLAQLAGTLTGVYRPDERDALRDEWD